MQIKLNRISLYIFMMCLGLLIFVQTSSAQSYSLKVHSPKFVGLDPPIRNAVIDQARWGCDNPNVILSSTSQAGAIIEITHYFEYHATITVFFTYYWYDNRNMMHVGSMEKFFMISCIGSTATLNETYVRMAVGDKFQLKVQASGYSGESPRWSTSNASIVSVSSSGFVTARRVGNATVTCDPIVGPSVSCTFEIYQPQLPEEDGGGDSGGGSGGDSGGSSGGGSGGGSEEEPDDDSAFFESLNRSVERLNTLRGVTSKFIDNNRIL